MIKRLNFITRRYKTMEKITFKNLNLLLPFYIFLLLSSISCSNKMDILFHDAKPVSPQFDYFICDSTVCPDTKFTSVGKTIILDLPDMDSKTSAIEWVVSKAPGGSTWYPPSQNAKIQSFTPDSTGIYFINVSYSAKRTRCSCDFMIVVDLPYCNTNICPGSTTISLGESTTLDIQGVAPDATQIYWHTVSSPGGATWNPPAQNAITETFTPSEEGTYNLQVSYVVDGNTCSCDFIVNVEAPCDHNICPGSTTISFGESTTLDIQGVTPLATNINWQVTNSPGGATWNPPSQNAITELFTPHTSGLYNLQVSYMYGSSTCSCDFNVNVEALCDHNICPGSTSVSVGETTTLDIQGINPLATNINWQVINSPGGATWNPPSQNAITESFTPNSSGIYNIQVSYMLGGTACSCEFTVEAIADPPICDYSICPGSTSVSVGDSTTLDIQGVNPIATQINWQVINSPGGASWNPSAQNAITESFTPNSSGTYNLQVSYMLGSTSCSCDFTVEAIEDPPVCDYSICPGSTSVTVGKTTTLDIKGVNPIATKIKWQVINSPGGASWKPAKQNAITELFTPNSSGLYNLQVSYMLGSTSCSCDFTVESKPPVIVPMTIKWTTSQKGIKNKGGWKIKDDGRRIRFDVEDSKNCGGSNNNIQSGVAKATITVGEDYTFIPTIEGIAELHMTGFEEMTVKLNGKVTVRATSKGGMKFCKMGPVNMSVNTPPPYILTPGKHTFELEFTTGDEMYHDGSYYEAVLKFKTR